MVTSLQDESSTWKARFTLVDRQIHFHPRQLSQLLLLLLLQHRLPSFSLSFLPHQSTPTHLKHQRPSTPFYSYHTIPYRQCLLQLANLDHSLMSRNRKHVQIHHVPLRFYQSKYAFPFMLLSIVPTRKFIDQISCFPELTLLLRSDNLSLAILTTNP